MKQVIRSRLAVLMAQKDPQLSQRALSRGLGVSPASIAILHNAEPISRVSAEVTIKLCNYFDCTLNDLYVIEEASP
jgi:putative transcriptional regulator